MFDDVLDEQIEAQLNNLYRGITDLKQMNENLLRFNDAVLEHANAVTLMVNAAKSRKPDKPEAKLRILK